jgi:hypothetical protein
LLVGHRCSPLADGSATRRLPPLVLHEGLRETGIERLIGDRSVAVVVARPTLPGQAEAAGSADLFFRSAAFGVTTFVVPVGAGLWKLPDGRGYGGRLHTI